MFVSTKSLRNLSLRNLVLLALVTAVSSFALREVLGQADGRLAARKLLPATVLVEWRNSESSSAAENEPKDQDQDSQA